MKPLIGVGIGVDTSVIGGELLHLIEAMIGWVSYRLVAKMPLAGEVGRIAVLLEELGDGWGLGAKVILVARGNHDRQRRADGNSSSDERGASRGATCLAVPTREDSALFGHLVDVGCGMAKGCASSGIS